MVLKSEADNPQRRGERATSDEVQLPLREHALASITDANEDDSETDSSSTASTPLATPEIVNHTLENTAEAASRQNRGKSPEATEPVPNVLEGELTPVTTREECLPKTKKKGGLITEVKAGDQIIYQEPESEDWNKVTLTSRGYRSTSLNKNYWNAKTVGENSSDIGVNLDKVDWLKQDTQNPNGLQLEEEVEASIAFAETISEEIFVLNTETCKSSNFQIAKENEIKIWKRFDVFTEVDRRDFADTEVISCKWVETEKSGPDQEIVYKSRLCVRGFEEKNPPNGQSPTADKNILRMFLALAVAYSWKVEMMDVRAAFLQSDPLTRVVLVKPPKEFRRDSNTVWKLNKPVYGLIDAARCWYQTVKRVLEELGCTALTLDRSIYIFRHDNAFAGFLIIHVDDFLIGGNESFKKIIITQLMKRFQIRCREQDEFTYIGWHINQDENGIHVDQNTYKETIQPIKMSDCRMNQAHHQLSEVETTQYQKLLGQLQWISSQSRPDVRFKVLECSIKANKPTVEEVTNINKVVKKLKKLSYGIYLPNLSGDTSKYSIIVFCDAALNNLPGNVGSTQAFIIFLECEGKVVPLSWSSKKIARVCKVILHAECMALSVSVDQALVLKETLIETVYGEKKGPFNIPINVFTDCYSLFQNIHSDNQAQDRKVRVEVAAIREQMDLKEINSIKWVPDESQLANPLTKSTGPATRLIEVLQSGRLNAADLYC